MYDMHYELDGVAADKSFRRAHVDTLPEAKVIARSLCCYLLAVVDVTFEYMGSDSYRVWVGQGQRGTINIKRIA